MFGHRIVEFYRVHRRQSFLGRAEDTVEVGAKHVNALKRQPGDTIPTGFRP
jgi:hypothetical protein